MLITMSEKDIYRFKVLADVREQRLRQVDVAVILAQRITHAAHDRPSNCRYSEDFKANIQKIIHEHYSDFSPALALEKLSDQHNLVVSKETLRQWMIAGGLWVPHAKRKLRVYQPRYRRDCLGELVLIDGSHHDWFG
ncbi:PFAM Integrase catalytic [Vibrio sp. B1FLJ16]|uniref:hypothetical protein n=1 Tax=Vibrio sp. B1FLJ16 TaxID=2751178 RepID=UPI0015F38C11|nr:hypothetical protein [Vibrio sp. B1FLJ16]CAD7805736.1 PFAM Integrase catalytic [Vibrio sp. B1FLJ16]CAE6900468.1 PFAM Integrase catalytic [Vibrio sp. B1FLJ16]